MSDWTETELAYLAGFIDGEGSITVFNFKDRNRPHAKPGSVLRLSIYNNDPDVMGWIALRFGGRVGKVKRRRVMWRQGYIWEQSGRKAAPIIAACLPYFKVKRQQAEIFLAVAATMKSGRRQIPANVLEFRQASAEKMSRLNRGHRAG